MKKSLLISLAGLLLLTGCESRPQPATSAPAQAAVRSVGPAQNYQADTAASGLSWTGHAAVGAYAPTGTLRLQAAQVRLQNGQPQAGRVVIAMTTLAAENPDLARHLRAVDFFDVAQFPVAVFELNRWQADAALGRLTIKGITRPIKVMTHLEKTGDKLRIRGQATINRTLFGITYNSPGYFANLGDQAHRG